MRTTVLSEMLTHAIPKVALPKNGKRRRKRTKAEGKKIIDQPGGKRRKKAPSNQTSIAQFFGKSAARPQNPGKTNDDDGDCVITDCSEALSHLVKDARQRNPTKKPTLGPSRPPAIAAAPVQQPLSFGKGSLHGQNAEAGVAGASKLLGEPGPASIESLLPPETIFGTYENSLNAQACGLDSSTKKRSLVAGRDSAHPGHQQKDRGPYPW